MERNQLTWIVFYWASNAECRPRRTKRSRLAAQCRQHRQSIEHFHGCRNDKQKKQRTGTSSSSSSSVISGSRRRGLLSCLPPNPRAPPPHHHRSAEGPRRLAHHQRHQSPWVPWL
ncbi:hypothetical protein TcCL_Unassigned01154 [Trypanosoma cruzi]|nr:hypothetical protein TcCL_Unassigned01154 [Trypanosoma cruzi]